MGRRREELLPGLRSFPIGNYVVFYREIKDGVDIIRILRGSRDIEAIFGQG
jgi:toxin ParE1/3/4